MSNRLSQERALQYMLAGNAIVVLHSLKTGKQFRYTIKRSPKPGEPIWYVYDALNPPWSKGYIGSIKKDLQQNSQFFPSLGAEAGSKEAINAMMWTIGRLRIQQVPEELHILHTGYCSVCSRPLKDAVSLEWGLGPECRKKLGIK